MIKKVFIELSRENAKVSIKIKIPPELEEFLKSISEGEPKISGKWFMDNETTTGAKFYNLSDKYTEIERALSDLGLHTYNDFGDGLLRQRAINLAPLRCVGVSGIDGITLYSENFENSGIDFEMYIRELALTVKTIWRDFISKKTLKAVISYEI